MEDSLLLGMRMEVSMFSIMTQDTFSIHCQVSFLNSCLRNLIANSCPGLVKPVRAVAFSPGGKLLAAAGDSKVIALYDVSSGEQVANFIGHGAWILSLGWSDTGEYLLSG